MFQQDLLGTFNSFDFELQYFLGWSSRTMQNHKFLTHLLGQTILKISFLSHWVIEICYDLHLPCLKSVTKDMTCAFDSDAFDVEILISMLLW